MKKDGFITVFVLLILAISILIVHFIINLINSQSMIEAAYKDKIQAELLSEAKILRLFHDEYYFNDLLVPNIHKHFRNQLDGKAVNFNVNFESNIDQKDLDTLVKGKFISYSGRKYIELTSKSEYNGFISNVFARGTIVSEIFEKGNPLLSYELDSDICEKLDNFYESLGKNIVLDNLPEDIKAIKSYDHETIKLINEKGQNRVTKIRNEVETIEIFSKDIILIITNQNNDFVELVVEDNMNIAGVLIVEGNIIINNDFKFNGIIILKGVDSKIIVNSYLKPVIKGIVITEGITDFYELMDIRYDNGFIYKYGIYLPGFLDPNLEILKKT